MNNKRFGRILAMKIAASSKLPYWQLKIAVDSAIEESLSLSCGIDNFLDDLHKRVVRFSYYKTDGSIREAVGTLKESLLTELVGKPKLKGGGYTACIVYFDLEKDAWRSFCPENFISFL